MKENLSNPFFKLIMPILTSIRDLQKNGSNFDAFTTGSLRNELLQLVNNFEIKALEQHINADHVYRVKCALVAYLDEWVLNNFAESASIWTTNPLQLEIFGGCALGVRFFDELSEMRIDADTYLSVLEVYYVLLEFGFSGKYAINGSSELIKIKKDLLGQITRLNSHNNTIELVHKLSKPTENRKKYSFTWFGISMASIAVLGVLWLSLYTSITFKSKKINTTLVQLNGN